jgi:hypothetical protein
MNSVSFEMANVSPKKTGLSTYIYVSYSQGQHGPRLKVCNVVGKSWSDDNFTVSISSDPKVVSGKVKISNKELDNVFNFMILNKNLLLDLWNGKIDNEELYDKVLKV